MKIFSMRTIRNTVVAAALVMAPAASFAGVFISVGFAPPALPVYVQPVAPGDGYLWNPGYWAYDPAMGGYYWVPGVWVQPPRVGVLWTPGYWGWGNGAYLWHEGYWGPHVGFYGGINYGFGYTGVGFWGGRWEGEHFAYNTAVMHVDRTVIHNTYIDNVHVTNVGVHTAFNGGTGGIQARPSGDEQRWSHENHVTATAEQQQHWTMAHADHSNFASANGGHPQNAAFARVGATTGVAARGANPSRDGFGHANEVNTRQGNQQSRINNGVRSGQLTPGETRNLENRDTSINRQAQADRAANGGRLTPQERQQVNQRQNNVSNSIARDDRNANNDRAAAARNDTTARQERQQAQRTERRDSPHPNEDHPRR
jgi:hypothetical protein